MTNNPTPPALTGLGQALQPLPAWGDEARCRDADPEAFFLEQGQRPDDAIAICATCPVRDECLEFALATESAASRFGVWGGLTARERRAIVDERAKAANLELRRPRVDALPPTAMMEAEEGAA